MSSLDRNFDEIAIARRYAPRDVSAVEACEAIIRRARENEIGAQLRQGAERTARDLGAGGPTRPSLASNPLDEIATLVRSLTYGEMMEFAGELWAKRNDGEITGENLPAILHRWSVRE